MPSLRRRHKVPTETGLTEAPETAHSRLTRRRSQRTFYAVTPTYWERYLARQTGRRDGRRGTIPDPEHGHTAHSHGIESKFRTTAEIEQIELARILAKTDERRERLATELDLLHVTLEAALDRATNAPEPASDPLVPANVDERRRHRARKRLEQSATARLDATRTRQRELQIEIAAIDVLRSHQIHVTDHRIHCDQMSRQQLIDVYWRSYLHTHPEQADVRAGYPIPQLALPALDAVATHHTSNGRKS